jgi:predicted outer membrane lipoprotein
MKSGGGLWRKLGVALACAVAVLGAMILGAMAQAPARTAGPCAVVDGPAILPALPEASGLAISRRQPGVVWSHNDSGNDEILFALDTEGVLLGQLRVPVQMRDWEDVSAGRCPSGPCLYLADIGDNGRSRKRVQILRIPEPAPGDAMTAPPDVFYGVYADGPHNAESMFVVGEDLFVITRDRIGAIYRSTVKGLSGGQITFQRIGQLGVDGVSDAEASPDEQTVAVRTEDEVLLFRTADLVAARNNPYARIPVEALREPQGEGVAIDGGGMIYLASEGRPWTRGGSFLSLRCTLP